MHLARLWSMKRQPFKAGLARSLVTRDREPCAPKGRRPTWPQQGPELPAWMGSGWQGRGGAREGRLS
jgi:hypothetical protein